MLPFPKAAGTYILFLYCAAPIRQTIGRLGAFDFAAGTYAYVGSAFGAGGLQGRLKHHLAPVVKPHWHIDYLRAVAPCFAVTYHADATRYEHLWAAALATVPNIRQPIPRFGASDCRCSSHLFYLPSEGPLTAASIMALHPVLNAPVQHYRLP